MKEKNDDKYGKTRLEQNLSELSGTVHPERDLWPEIRNRLKTPPAGYRRRKQMFLAAAAVVVSLTTGILIGLSFGRNTDNGNAEYMQRILMLETEYQRLKPMTLKAVSNGIHIPRDALERLKKELESLDESSLEMISVLEEYDGESGHYASVFEYYRKKFEIIRMLRNLSLPPSPVDRGEEKPEAI